MIKDILKLIYTYMIKGYNGFLLQQLKAELFSLNEDNLYASSELLVKLKKMSKMDGKVGEIANAIVDTIEGINMRPKEPQNRDAHDLFRS